MKFCDYFKMIIGMKHEATNADFLRAITENFIREPYKNELYLDIDFNPIEKYYDNDETLKSICNGNTNMNKACAAELYSLYDKEKLIGFFSNREYNFEPYKELIIANGFKIEIVDGDEDILATMADLLAKIFHDISEGKKESFPPLQKLNIKVLENDAFKQAYIKENCIFIEGQCIHLPFTVNEIKDNEELPYVKELLKVYSEKIGVKINSINELNQYKDCLFHFNRQRRSYFSAEAIKRSVRDLFADGQDNFKLIQDEMFSAVEEVYFNVDTKDGYTRLSNVLNMALKANLNSTILLNIRGLITAEERKGICHILVNDGVIHSWVEVIYD